MSTESAMSLPQVTFLLGLFAPPRVVEARAGKTRRTFAQQLAKVASLVPKGVGELADHFAKPVRPEQWVAIAEVADPANGESWHLYRKNAPTNRGEDGVGWDMFRLTIAGPDRVRAETLGRKRVVRAYTTGVASFNLAVYRAGFAEGSSFWAAATERPGLLLAAAPYIRAASRA